MADRTATIVGGRGYVGGELVRLLLAHPDVALAQVTSDGLAGHPVHAAHPNLRGTADHRFVATSDLAPCDLLFLALPHGQAAESIERYAPLAPRIVDCSADFRLRDPATYRRWYGTEHAAPSWLDRFVYGLPERHRASLRSASHASGVGCNATATILALGPLADAGLLARAVVDVKVGSSEAGARPTESSHHPERSGAVRPFRPTGHRHQAEVRQALGDGFDLSFSVTSVDLVRGVLATAHCFLTRAMDQQALWKLYRAAYEDEPFVRIVSQRSGLHRYPQPKITAGSNFCDVGFEADAADGAHAVVMAALDNLVKGAAGSALQSMNVMAGFDERAGLAFPGLHPV